MRLGATGDWSFFDLLLPSAAAARSLELLLPSFDDAFFKLGIMLRVRELATEVAHGPDRGVAPWLDEALGQRVNRRPCLCVSPCSFDAPH